MRRSWSDPQAQLAPSVSGTLVLWSALNLLLMLGSIGCGSPPAGPQEPAAESSTIGGRQSNLGQVHLPNPTPTQSYLSSPSTDSIIAPQAALAKERCLPNRPSNVTEEPILEDQNRRPLVPLKEHFTSRPTRLDVIEVALARSNQPLPEHPTCPHGDGSSATIGQYLARQLTYLHRSECYPGIRVVVEDNWEGRGLWMCELLVYHVNDAGDPYAYGIRFFVDMKTGLVDESSFWCPGAP